MTVLVYGVASCWHRRKQGPTQQACADERPEAEVLRSGIGRSHSGLNDNRLFAGPVAWDTICTQSREDMLTQVEDGQDIQVALEDLTLEERAVFEAELASGALARLVLPWEPWWRSAEAQRLSLSSAGTRLIQQAGAGSAGSPLSPY